MKAKVILLTAVIVLGTSSFVQAQEGQLSGTISLSYLNKYIWRGFDYYGDDHSAYRADLDVDLYGTGFGVEVLWARPFSAPLENSETLGVGLYYGNSCYQDETYVTDFKIGWAYYGYPDEPRNGNPTSMRGQAADMQELYLTLSWPKICPAGVVPSYTIVDMWPSEGKSRARNNAGLLHILGLGYDFDVPGVLPDTPEQKVHLSAETVYNSGAAPGTIPGPGVTGSKIDHDWSHALFGISTDFNLTESLVFTPALYYQSSWEDSVNTEDQCWFTLGLAYKF